MAIGIVEIAGLHSSEGAIAQHHVAINQNAGNVAAIGAAIHPHEAAHGARDGTQEFKPRNAAIARGGGNQNAAGPAAAIQRVLACGHNPGKRLAQPNHHTGHPAIAHDEIAAKAQRHNRHRRIKRRQELA